MPEGCEICVVVHFFFRHKIPYPLLHDASLTHQTHIWLVVKKTEKSACKSLEKDIPPEHSLVEIQNDLTPCEDASLPPMGRACPHSPGPLTELLRWENLRI